MNVVPAPEGIIGEEARQPDMLARHPRAVQPVDLLGEGRLHSPDTVLPSNNQVNVPRDQINTVAGIYVIQTAYFAIQNLIV